MNRRSAIVWPALATGLALTGCAGIRTIDSDVTSYSQWPAGRKPASYAYERLPSQQAQAQLQETLEAAARDALAQAGFVEAANPADAEVSVQVGARVNRYAPWDDPFWGHAGFGFGRSHRFGWWGPGMGMNYEPPRYEREVGVLMRDRKTGQVLYEARASNESLSGADSATFAAMFEAALKDFPQPAVNPRRVSVPLPKQ
jgi:hypothetical protein